MGKPNVVHTIFIAAKPDKVWAALIDRELSRKYFFGNSVEVGTAVGAPFAVRKPDGTLDVEGKVLAIEASRRLLVSWRVVWLPDLPETQVEYLIEDLGDAVKVTVGEYHGAAHDQVKEKFAEASRDGWALILSGIKTILETGAPLPPIKPKPPK